MKLKIAICKNRRELIYKNGEISWEDLVKKLSKPQVTHETYTQYMCMKKNIQDEIKDVGGYVGGELLEGKRRRDSVKSRSFLALDLDFAQYNFFDTFQLMFGYKAICYSTHKHSVKTPKYRLILPLLNPIESDQYEPIARYIASQIGIDMFDDTSFQAERMMYFPSVSIDGEYFFREIDGEIVDPKKILNNYSNWKDVSLWPISSRVNTEIRRDITKQENPLTKTGFVGAFCRTYSIESVIEKYLQDVYVAGTGGRYTYIKGSSSNGVVVYDNVFSYSHHGTDPASMRLCNAFDLVRIHKFKDLDQHAKTTTNTSKLPSFRQMIELIKEDKKVVSLLNSEYIKNIFKDLDFSTIDQEDYNLDWLEKLTVDSKGKPDSTVDNIKLIISNDINLKGSLGYNEFSERVVVKKNLPWRELDDNNKLNNLADIDMAGFRHYLEKFYKITSVQKVQDGVELCAFENKFHPIRDYLQSLVWDKVKRLDTLFIDYLGADDNELVRVQTRKALTACVARVFKKGIKFDYVLTLVGAQGVGKSTILSKLGGDYYNESINLQKIDKDTIDGLRGSWIIEFGELTGLKKAETEAVKNFISRTHDEYRKAYGRNTSVCPRQCVFFGTSNEDEFLKDATGNRRWWVVRSNAEKVVKDVFNDLTKYEVDQIWAEAVDTYNKGEKLYLTKKLEKMAKEIQEEFTEKSPLQGAIEEFLEIPIPKNWNKMDDFQRGQYYRNLNDSRYSKVEKVKRDKVCVQLVWVECFGRKLDELKRINSYEISKCLSSINGWEKKEKREYFNNYGTQRCYIKT